MCLLLVLFAFRIMIGTWMSSVSLFSLELRSANRYCDNYRVSGALEKFEHETILQDRASDR